MSDKTKPPLRERRYQDTLKTIERAKGRRDAAIRMLIRYEILIPKLERKARRLGAPSPSRSSRSLNETPTQVESLPTIEPKIEADGIPDFLQRGVAAQQAAQTAIVQAEVDLAKKRKADLAAEKRKIKEEVRKAELTGQRRKLPLSGKDALAAIREE